MRPRFVTRGASSLSLPASVVIAGALIGLGLYLGLRQETSVERPPPNLEAASMVAVSPEALAAAALALHLPEVWRRCEALVDPSWGGGPHGTLDATFDVDGRQLARSFLERRGASRPGLSGCVQETLPALNLPPLGRVARVQLPVDLRRGAAR